MLLIDWRAVSGSLESNGEARLTLRAKLLGASETYDTTRGARLMRGDVARSTAQLAHRSWP